jgi:hypothetical protein
MPLLPDDLLQRIPPLHTQDSLPDNQLTAYARLTIKAIDFTWFLLELHSDQDTFSAYLIDPQKEQFGYFSFSYIEEHLGIAALEVLGEIPGEGMILSLEEVPSAIAYDERFMQKPLVEAVRQERKKRHGQGEGLPISASLSPHRAYYYAASYPQNATQVYRTIRDIIHREPLNLSAFQVPPSSLSHSWHIVVIGDRPPEVIHEQIMKALRGGTITIIPYELVMQLFARKLEQNQKGPWREGHTNIQLKHKMKPPRGMRYPRHGKNKGRS